MNPQEEHMFYSLETRTDKEVGNRFPQMNSTSQFWAHQLRDDEFPARPELAFELETGAKLTDLVSQASINAKGMLVSVRFRDLLAKFNLMRHEVYPASVVCAGDIEDYYWVHLNEDFAPFIDFRASTFKWTEFTFEQGPISIASLDDYQLLKEQHDANWGVNVDLTELLIGFPNIDLFYLRPFDYTIYVSRRLRDAVLGAGMTGVEIREATSVRRAAPSRDS